MTATINIGLAIGDRDLRVEETDALNAILAHTGDRPITYAVVQSDTEPTLVAVLEEEPGLDDLAALCSALEQDCVAVQPEGGKGFLYGPRPAAWGPFDPAKFIDWPTASVRAARAALHQAELANREVERVFEAAKTAARHAVEKEHAEARNAASRTLGEARRALLLAENAAAPVHEWEGKTVIMREPKNTGSRWSPKPSETRFNERRGVVFTYKHGIDLGRGRGGWGAQPGNAYVRLLKKDGTPGKMTERLTETGAFGAKWELV